MTGHPNPIDWISAGVTRPPDVPACHRRRAKHHVDMKFRESVQRFLIETHQVTQSRRYLWLCAIYMIVTLAGALHVFEPEYWQMRRVRRHIEDIRPQWEAFKRVNPGFNAVELFAEYDEASGVVFAARGRISPLMNQLQLYEFMLGTRPPCSVELDRLNTELSGIPTAPAMRKVVTVDGRRMVVLVPAETYPRPSVTPAGSPARPAGPTPPDQAIRVESHPTPSVEGLER